MPRSNAPCRTPGASGFSGRLRAWSVLALLAAWAGPGTAPAAFLDFSVPVRGAGLGGNAVALPEGTSSLYYNPAGLGGDSRFHVSARYENLFAGVEGDDLSTGNLSAVFPLWAGDAVGFSVDHFGSANLQQDRLSAAFGKSFGISSPLAGLRVGVSLSYLRQQFTLSAPLAGVNPGNVSAGAFSVGAGVLYSPRPGLTFGVSGEDLNRPNLGVIGTDEVPALLRYGVAVKPPVGEDRLALTLSQSLSGGFWETQGGAEWEFTRLNVSVRAGADADTGAVGLGWSSNGLSLDYAYQFSWNQAPSLDGVGLPGSHLLEVSFTWENASREEAVLKDLIAKGRQEMKAGKWREAYWYYQHAYLLKPDDRAVIEGRSESLRQYNERRAEAYFAEGQKAENKGYFQEAQRDYEWALYLWPGNSRFSRARDRVKKSRTQGALSDPRVRGLLEKSVQLVKRGENRRALEKIREARKLYPGDAFLDFLSRAFSRKNYSQLKPEDKRVERMSIEAEIYRSKGRLDLARETWKKILQVDPGNPMARENLEENPKQGSANRLSAADRDRAQALLEAGLKDYANGDTAGAVRKWESVLKIDPLNVNALNNLTRVRMEEGGAGQ